LRGGVSASLRKRVKSADRLRRLAVFRARLGLFRTRMKARRPEAPPAPSGRRNTPSQKRRRSVAA